jgi:hypothetical protein
VPNESLVEMSLVSRHVRRGGCGTYEDERIGIDGQRRPRAERRTWRLPKHITQTRVGKRDKPPNIDESSEFCV